MVVAFALPPPSTTVLLMVGTLVGALLIALAVTGLVVRMRTFERRIGAAAAGLNNLRRDYDRQPKEKGRGEELAQLRHEIQSRHDSLRSAIDRIPDLTAQRIAAVSPSMPAPLREPPAPSWRPPAPAAVPDPYQEPPQRTEDPVAQLLSIANRIVQQSSTTVDDVRARTSAFAAQVSAWPQAAEGAPLAFIVEHRGACYAVPNVVKPGRLPQEWFNRSEFGVNDEIQRVVSLPRLRRRGDGYDVQEPGVFAR